MNKTVFITGSFGNIGESVLLALFKKKKYNIFCFDIHSKQNTKVRKKLSQLGDFHTIWGDITDFKSLESHLTSNIDCIIHLAAIIPPLSERNVNLSDSVNIEGTKNLILSASKLKSKPKFIFSSSLSVFGPRSPDMPLLTTDQPPIATDNYTRQKITCEDMIKDPLITKLPWTILRLAAIPPISIDPKNAAILFDSPLNQKIEFAHTRDVGHAIVEAIEKDTTGKTLLIGGGKNCQMRYNDFISKCFEIYGFGALSSDAFKKPEKPSDWYYTHWMDTSESENLLSYQKLTFEDYLSDMKKSIGYKRFMFKLAAPLIRNFLVGKSRYST
jgi:nucleoside-diphosphate-sugar epimerase